MKKLLHVLALLLLAASAAQAQGPAWQEALLVGHARGKAPRIQAIAADTLDNVYVAGYFTGKAGFGSTILNAGRSELPFLAKWSDDKHRYCWATPLSHQASIYHLAAGGGAVYIAGGFKHKVQLGDTTLTENHGGAEFIAKLLDQGSTGRVVWAQQVVEVGETWPGAIIRGLAVRGGAVYVAGEFTGAVRLGNTLLRSTAQESKLFGSVFVAKLTETNGRGRFSWAQCTGGTGSASRPKLAVAGDRIYVTGGFWGTIIWGTKQLASPPGQGGAFVVKLLDAGPTAAVSWVAPLTVGESDTDIEAVAATGTTLYVAGNASYIRQILQDGQVVPTGTGSTFVVKLEDMGDTAQLVWKQEVIRPEEVSVMSLALRGSRLYLSGVIGGHNAGFLSADASSGTAFDKLTTQPIGPSDLFLAQLRDEGPSGNFEWVRRLGGKSRVGVLSNALGQLAIASVGMLYFAAALGPPVSIDSQPIISQGARLADYLLLFKLPH
jgi:hypothetical protein